MLSSKRYKVEMCNAKLQFVTHISREMILLIQNVQIFAKIFVFDNNSNPPPHHFQMNRFENIFIQKIVTMMRLEN